MYSSRKTYDGPPADDYGYDIHSPPPPGSYYVEDVPQYFYKWNSPPGVVRILEGLGILLSVAIFACVASTLAWEYGYGYGSLYGSGMGSYYGGGYGSGMSYYGGGYGGLGGYGGYGGYYGGMTNPRAANGFMIAMSVLAFIALLALLITSLSKSSGSRSRKFYLVVIIVCAILAFIMLIASIVYLVGVNPRAQMSGSYNYNYSPMLAMCNQIYSTGTYINQYLYHYCIVDPQEAIAIVCGFLLVILLCVICFFASKTRKKIWRYGKANIYWDKPPPFQEGPNVEEWVKNVADVTSNHDETATLAYSEKPTSPVNAPASPYNAPASPYNAPASPYNAPGSPYNAPASPYNAPTSPYGYRVSANGYYGTENRNSTPLRTPPDNRARTFSTSTLEEKVRDTPSKPSARRGRRRRRNPELDESQYETDYTTAVESSDEQDQDEWKSLYPPITSDRIRQEYKQDFASDLKHYKQLCAEMDSINDQINQLSKQLDHLPEDSLQYQGVAEEYNRLKDLKRTPDYQSKKMESKSLRNKLFHIKRMVSDYDKNRS
ncbi:occludin-like [Sphaerodactylus townsendi]|nr:occludin-like [Sphaerodactylus townsendi]XP_048351673.1 occludin-like [Sphaerodactylus townsendi]XP_048351674.1 occludin-like [Sphaerodactylus townsendi]XP_048351675.1 occludin-like [Sphaerodactylus townsendi]